MHIRLSIYMHAPPPRGGTSWSFRSTEYPIECASDTSWRMRGSSSTGSTLRFDTEVGYVVVSGRCLFSRDRVELGRLLAIFGLNRVLVHHSEFGDRLGDHAFDPGGDFEA